MTAAVDPIRPIAPPTLLVPIIRVSPILGTHERTYREIVEIIDVPLPPGATALGYGAIFAPEATAAAAPAATLGSPVIRATQWE